MSQAFNYSRMELARKRRGMTQRELAQAVGITPQSLALYRTGSTAPLPMTVAAIARSLRFPEEFFYGSDLEEPASDGISFRSLSRMTARQREMARAQGSLAVHLSRWIEKRFDLPSPDFPDLRDLQKSPSVAATTLRQIWGLGELSIRNMVHLLESKGARIFSLSIEAKEVDAFSVWVGKAPFVLLNNFKSPEHSRFDAAHELGHLVLHRHGHVHSSREMESQADSFASAFLMPERTVMAHAPKLPTLNALINVKKLFGVSLLAMAYRLHSLKLLTEWNYRSLCIEIGSRGYRTSEPEGTARETSIVLREILTDLYASDGVTRSDIARDLGLPPGELEALSFGLTLGSIPGGGGHNRQRSPKAALFYF